MHMAAKMTVLAVRIDRLTTGIGRTVAWLGLVVVVSTFFVFVDWVIGTLIRTIIGIA